MGSSITRDTIQGFIDGCVYCGADPSSLSKNISEWLSNHPSYKPDAPEIDQVAKDVSSYRISDQSVIAPSKKAPLPTPSEVID